MLIITLSNVSVGQSKQAMLWPIGCFLLDFSTGKVSISEMSPELNNPLFYVDEKAQIRLINTNRRLFDGDMNIIDVGGDIGVDFFVPMPGNSNLVYCFGSSSYYIVNIDDNTVVDFVQNFGESNVSSIRVHHSNCRDIWIIYFTKTSIVKYLLTANGFSHIETIDLSTSDYAFDLSLNKQWRICLSLDCRFYTAVADVRYDSEVYYGSFDRSTGNFKRISSYKLPSRYTHAEYSLISHDGSKIYYDLRNHNNGLLEIVESPIIDGIPDYSKIRIIDSPTTSGMKSVMYLYYGFDGAVYSALFRNKKLSIGKIEIDNNGESHFYDEIKTKDNFMFNNKVKFLSSWYGNVECDNSSAIPPSGSHTACLNSTTDYFIDNPVEGSKYVWNISPSGMGEIVSNSESYDKISVKWEKVGDAKIYVYEVNSLDCNSDASSIEVKVLESPDAGFDNSTLCYGEPLNVILSGESPFTLEYTLDNESFSIFDINSNIYKMPETAGKYSIIKVIDKNCSAIPENNNNAVIGKQMKPLKIMIGE